MGNTILIKERRIWVKLLRSRLEAIQKLQNQTAIKSCRNFAGMVNFLRLFAQNYKSC